MTSYPLINYNCQHFRSEQPCNYHKSKHVVCDNCAYYAPIRNKILIIKLAALGDVLRTTSILPALHEKYPNSSVTWITKRNALPIFSNNPFVHRVFAVEDNYIEHLLSEEFNIGFCLEADTLSGAILAISNCKEKLGYIKDRQGYVRPCNDEAFAWFLMGINDILKRENRKTYQSHIYTICRLQENIHKPILNLSKQDLNYAEEFLNIHRINNNSKIIGINTGGGNRWQLKKWVNGHYIELINKLEANYPDVGLILFGGPQEVEFNSQILKEVSKKVIDAGCDNSITQFASLINLVDIFLTPDSLGMHISVALDKNTLVLVGPTSPWELDVFGRGEIIYNQDLKCISCYKNTCDKSVNCMNTLKPELILDKIMNYL